MVVAAFEVVVWVAVAVWGTVALWGTAMIRRGCWLLVVVISLVNNRG